MQAEDFPSRRADQEALGRLDGAPRTRPPTPQEPHHQLFHKSRLPPSTVIRAMTYLSDVFFCPHTPPGEVILTRSHEGLVICQDCGCHRVIKEFIRGPWTRPLLATRAAERLLTKRYAKLDGERVRLTVGLLKASQECEHGKRRVHEFWSNKNGAAKMRQCLRICLDCGRYRWTQGVWERLWCTPMAALEAHRRRAQRLATKGGSRLDFEQYFELIGN